MPTPTQFEDMAYDNASKLLNMYRTEFPCFNDDMSGTAAAVLSGVMAALQRTGGRLSDHRIVFAGGWLGRGLGSGRGRAGAWAGWRLGGWMAGVLGRAAGRGPAL